MVALLVEVYTEGKEEQQIFLPEELLQPTAEDDHQNWREIAQSLVWQLTF